MFREQTNDRSGSPFAYWMIAGAVVLAVALALVVYGSRHVAKSPNTLEPVDAYAASLPLSQLAMSESTSLSGGKSTFIDGHVQNTGSKTVTGMTLQVVFKNDEGMPPQIETTPLLLIRTHEPYVDTQAVSAAPLKPGDDREFRLIFESLPGNWNMQMPEIRVVETKSR